MPRKLKKPQSTGMMTFWAAVSVLMVRRPSDVPKTISTSGTPSVNSTLSVASGDTIDDVNLLNLNGTHTWINDLDFNLTSPDGTTAQVMAQSCYNQNNFDLNLDDEATPGNWPCPPTGGGTYQPSNPLSAFDGEDSTGTWTLRVDDNANYDGGGLNGWSLEICTTAAGGATPTGAEKSFTLNAYDGSSLGTAPTKGNPTLARSYSQVTPSASYIESECTSVRWLDY